MLYSGIWQLRRQLSSCFVALILCGCGNGEHSAAGTPAPATLIETQQNSVPRQAAVTVSASTNEGGYVTNQNASMFCDSASEFCHYQTANDSIESLKAVSRFGYHFTQWQSNAAEQTTSTTGLQLIADQNISVQAAFEKQPSISEPNCTVLAQSPRFRTLHLGDSLTVVQCWGTNCPTYSAISTQEPERESVRFYETTMASNTDVPRTIAWGGNRSIGTNFFYSSVADEPLDVEHDNYWQSTLEQHHESLENFGAVVVALGSNDIFDVSYATIDMDFIFEYRIKPLMRWLGNKPVLWILPHYSLNKFARGNLNLSAKSDGLACSCGQNAAAETACNLPQAIEQCGATDDETRATIAMFKLVHEFRARLADLRTEYPNLQVFDPATLISEQSHGLYDLYQQMEGDKIHFNRQGAEWFAWAQAHVAQTVNPACAEPIASWNMGAAENEMISRLP